MLHSVAPLIGLFFVEDSAVFRAGLLCWAEVYGDLRIVGSAASAEEALPAILRGRPDVVILDLGLPGMGGLEALRVIKRAHPATRVVVVTLDDSAWARAESAGAGADAFVPKTAVAERLYEAIRGVTSVASREVGG